MKAREIWRVVPSVERLLASSHGRLMLVPEQKPMPRGGTTSRGGVPTRGSWDGTRFVWQHRGTTHKVARLVCEAFNGAAPADKPVCMHVDENAQNNRPTNLKWATQRENLNCPRFLDYCRGRTGENSPTVKGRKAA